MEIPSNTNEEPTSFTFESASDQLYDPFFTSVYPQEAMDFMYQHPEQTKAWVISVFQDSVKYKNSLNQQWDDSLGRNPMLAIVFALYFARLFKVKEIHQDLIELLRSDEDTIDDMLGDTLNEHVPFVLMHTATDPDLMLQFLSEKGYYEFNYTAVLDALIFCCVKGQIATEKVKDAVSDAFDSVEDIFPKYDYCWLEILNLIKVVNPDKFLEIKNNPQKAYDRMFKQDSINIKYGLQQDDVDEILTLSYEDFINEELDDIERRDTPTIADVHKQISRWACFQDEVDYEDNFDPMLDLTDEQRIALYEFHREKAQVNLQNNKTRAEIKKKEKNKRKKKLAKMQKRRRR